MAAKAPTSSELREILRDGLMMRCREPTNFAAKQNGATETIRTPNGCLLFHLDFFDQMC
jgi:hypothetical protein